MKAQIRNKGFTLVEICIALFVASICALIGFNIVNSATNLSQSLQERSHQLSQFIQVQMTIQSDLDQVYSPFSLSQKKSDHKKDLNFAISGDQEKIVITTNSLSIKDGHSISTPRRVTYHFEQTENQGTKISRSQTPMEKGVQIDLPPVRTKSTFIEYFDDKLIAHRKWPPEKTKNSKKKRVITHHNPKLIKINLKHERFEDLTVSSSTF